TPPRHFDPRLPPSAECATGGNNGTALAHTANGASCTAGASTSSACTAPFFDCNGNKTDGCEINTNTSIGNCGGCGSNCAVNVLNASGATCDGAGACTYSICNPGSADCNHTKTDGCESNTTTTNGHCGGCGGDSETD